MHTWNSPWKYNGRSRFTFKKHNRWFRFTLKSESESGPSIMFSWSFIYIFFMYPIFSLRIRVAYFFFSPFSGKISKQWLSVEVITTLMVPVCKSPKPWYVLKTIDQYMVPLLVWTILPLFYGASQKKTRNTSIRDVEIVHLIPIRDELSF